MCLLKVDSDTRWGCVGTDQVSNVHVKSVCPRARGAMLWFVCWRVFGCCLIFLLYGRFSAFGVISRPQLKTGKIALRASPPAIPPMSMMMMMMMTMMTMMTRRVVAMSNGRWRRLLGMEWKVFKKNRREPSGNIWVNMAQLPKKGDRGKVSRYLSGADWGEGGGCVRGPFCDDTNQKDQTVPHCVNLGRPLERSNLKR